MIIDEIIFDNGVYSIIFKRMIIGKYQSGESAKAFKFKLLKNGHPIKVYNSITGDKDEVINAFNIYMV